MKEPSSLHVSSIYQIQTPRNLFYMQPIPLISQGKGYLFGKLNLKSPIGWTLVHYGFYDRTIIIDMKLLFLFLVHVIS